jgi:Flp pilus assembly protein TadD
MSPHCINNQIINIPSPLSPGESRGEGETCMKFVAAILALIFSTQLLIGCTTTHTQRATTTSASTADINAEYQNALESMQTEQWQSASIILARITELNPSLSGPWINLGITRIMRGDHASAETAFKTALEVNHRNIEAYNQLGMLYRRHGRLDEAQLIYEEALRLDPDNTNIHWNLAILYDRYLPNPSEALQHYQRYQQLTGSEDPQLLAWIARLGKRDHVNMTARMKQ